MHQHPLPLPRVGSDQSAFGHCGTVYPMGSVLEPQSDFDKIPNTMLHVEDFVLMFV